MTTETNAGCNNDLFKQAHEVEKHSSPLCDHLKFIAASVFSRYGIIAATPEFNHPNATTPSKVAYCNKLSEPCLKFANQDNYQVLLLTTDSSAETSSTS